MASLFCLSFHFNYKKCLGMCLGILALGAMSGCAGSAPDQKSGQQNPGRQNQSSDASQKIPCGGTQDSQNDSIGLNLNQLMTASISGQQESICQTLARKGKSVGIFQISGVYCSTCQEDATYVRQQNLSELAHVIVFTDQPNTLEPDEQKNFFSTGPVGLYRFDIGLSLFRTLSPGKADLFGTTIVASVTGDYRVFVHENQRHQWVAAARELSSTSQ